MRTAAVALLLAATCASAQAKTFGGMVRDVATGVPAPPAQAHASTRAHPAHANELSYEGGPVLNSNRTHLIFWQPAGSGLAFDPGYEALIERFLAQVAADSHETANVYALTGQYRDDLGPAAYDSTYAGAVLATDPLPPNGCMEPLLTGPGWGACLSDAQLQSEIAHVIAVDRLPTDTGDVYFLITPNGLGDCIGSGPDNCALGGSATGYCAYHSSSPDDRIIYAVIPYNAIPDHCQSGNPRPNASTADPTISSISHEQTEMVTDPLGNAWIDEEGEEAADLCITSFGPDLDGSTGARAYDEDIAGGHYYLQELWSNADDACEPRAQPDSDWFVATASLALLGRPVSFAAHATDPEGLIDSYLWFFGGGPASQGRRARHAFTRTGLYRVVLRTVDSWGNWAFSAQTIRVAAPPR